MQANDDYTVVTKEISSKDLLKRIFNQAEREAKGPPKRQLLDAAARKEKLKAEKASRSKRDKARRAERIRQGLCTRCGINRPVLGCKLCSDCQLKGRNYMKGR